MAPDTKYKAERFAAQKLTVLLEEELAQSRATVLHQAKSDPRGEPIAVGHLVERVGLLYGFARTLGIPLGQTGLNGDGEGWSDAGRPTEETREYWQGRLDVVVDVLVNAVTRDVVRRIKELVKHPMGAGRAPGGGPGGFTYGDVPLPPHTEIEKRIAAVATICPDLFVMDPPVRLMTPPEDDESAGPG